VDGCKANVYPPQHFLFMEKCDMKTRFGTLVMSSALAGLLTGFGLGCSQSSDTASVPPASTTIGTEIDDSVISTRVKSALLADPDVKGFDFKIATRKGEVQLSGFVDNQVQLDRALAVTQAVPGVKSIDNKVSLKGAATTIGNKVDDSIVTTQVKAALLGEASIKSLDIAVVTRQGVVQLSGFVNDQTQISRAIEVAHGIAGVSSVSNEMSIKK
jgi:hyperosmotically inducible protein